MKKLISMTYIGTKTRVAILGAGFGGMYTFLELKKHLGRRKDVEIMVVNNRNYFLFTPMLHEVATGGISPENIIEPIRGIMGRGPFDLCVATVKSISARDHVVRTTIADLKFDYLVVALGAKTNFYNIPGAEDYTYELKDLESALKIKNKIIENIEKAAHLQDQSKLEKLLHFIVIGGGPTGVELAGELADFVRDAFGTLYPRGLISQVKITLIQRGPDLVPQFSPQLRAKAAQALTRKGVTILFNQEVIAVGPDGIKLADGTSLVADLVVWSAGVAPQVVPFDVDLPLTKDNRIIVNENLQLPDHPEIFVIGDQASFTNPQETKPLPALAQVASKQGPAVARNILRLIDRKRVRPYRYQHAGVLLSLGQYQAIGEVWHLKLSGYLTWWLWRMVYLSKLLTLDKKLQVALDWLIDIFLPRDISDYYEDKKNE